MTARLVSTGQVITSLCTGSPAASILKFSSTVQPRLKSFTWSVGDDFIPRFQSSVVSVGVESPL